MDRSVGSPWTRSVLGVRGPGVSVFGLPEAERVPNFITQAIDPNFLVNYIPVAGYNTMKILMYLASVSTRETCSNSQMIST